MKPELAKAIELLRLLNEEDSNYAWRLERHEVYPAPSDHRELEPADYENPLVWFVFVAISSQDNSKSWRFFVNWASSSSMEDIVAMTREPANETRRIIEYLIADRLKYPYNVQVGPNAPLSVDDK